MPGEAWEIVNTAEILFEYVRDILYTPAKAKLDLDALDPEYRKLGQGLQFFAQTLDEQRQLASALAKGNLSVPLPPPGNELAAPLKALHATLKHLTWQTQEVAKGNYQHRLDFMGEFATAFNTMVQQLDDRQKALEREIENTRQKTLELEQSNSLLEALTQTVSQLILVADVETGEPMFVNSTAQTAFEQDAALQSGLNDWIAQQLAAGLWKTQQGEAELKIDLDEKPVYFSIACYPINWREHRAVAYVLSDVSTEKERLLQLERDAYHDNLTKVRNRHYGMQILNEVIEADQDFCLCFADLDNLKYVNDNYGHSEGDKYLIHVAELLSDFSQGAVVSRLGGDEFMLIAPGYSRKKAEKRMQEVREALIASYERGESPYMRSISYGVVQVKPGTDQSASELLGIADERMYEFKRAHKAQRKSANQ